MDEDKIIELLTDIRISCAETRTKIGNIQDAIDKHEARIGKLENGSGSSIKQDILFFGVKIIGWLILIIASLTGAVPLINKFGN